MTNQQVANCLIRKLTNIKKFLAKHDMQLVLDACTNEFSLLPSGVELLDIYYPKHGLTPPNLKNPSAVQVAPSDINKMVLDVKLPLEIGDTAKYVCFNKNDIALYAEPALIKKMGANEAEV